MPCDYRKYPRNWFTEIRPRILERAKHHCERCGVRNYEKNPATGSRVVLTIAHLDQDITNNDFSNLAALCQKCHNTIDAPHRARHRTTNRMTRKEELGQGRLL